MRVLEVSSASRPFSFGLAERQRQSLDRRRKLFRNLEALTPYDDMSLEVL